MKPRFRYRPGQGIFRQYSWREFDTVRGIRTRHTFVGPYASIEDALKAAREAPCGQYFISRGPVLSERLMNALEAHL